MDPNTMRRIDFWVGVPLCFVLTIGYWLWRLLGLARSGEPARPKRVVFIQLAEMGTMVVAYPAIRKIRELFPDATVHVLCFEQIRSSVEILDTIDPNHIITIDSRSAVSLVRDTIRWLWTARRRGIDTVINLEAFVRYSSLLTFLSGARTRVGFHRFNQEGLYTGDLLTHKVLYNAYVHAGHTFLDLVHALEAPDAEIPRVKRPLAGDQLTIPKLVTDAAAAQRVWSLLSARNPHVGPSHKLVVMNPNASKRFPMRRLPLDAYADLATRLLADPEVVLLITGVAEEGADARYICERVGSPRALDLTGATTLTDLLHLFNLAQVLITNDSGPAHFACLTNAHVVVFFGPELPDRYRPLSDRCDVIYGGYSCSPCVSPYNQRLTPCNNNLCLQSISIERVARLVSARLVSLAHA